MPLQFRFLRLTDLRRSGAIALGLTAFLAILRPFDINPVGWDGWLALLGLAPVNFALLLLAHQIPARVLGVERRIWIFPAIFLGNGGYVALITGFDAPGLWLWQILAVGAVVLGAVTILTRLESYRAEIGAMRQTAESAPAQPGTAIIQFSSDGDSDLVQLRPDQILCLRAEANYVELIWRDASGIKRKFLRSTLISLLEQAGEGVLMRVHRSWAVNLSQATTISGTSHRLEIDFGDAVLAPVSRVYVQQVKQIASDLKAA